MPTKSMTTIEVVGTVPTVPDRLLSHSQITRSVARFNHQIASIQWDEVVFENGKHPARISLPEPGTKYESSYHSAMREASDYADFLQRLRPL